ncbi:LptF/LptG family permease [Sulfidibacter corallicola]|uniref:LptF/LptG family permease n=1 Tax=Sulfidibacter corallicola TaxID=2818388 RepID=A0A8A4TPC4_SULCO|nr:LptF/LptG family permease [Sulfidibacter corallicola]QTD51054.1 LptF/LptG family permease [Sulfidibacter corallicola]
MSNANSQKQSRPDGPTPLRRWGLWPFWTRLDSYIFGEIHRPFIMAMLVYNGIFFIKTLAAVAELSGGKFEVPLGLLSLFFISEIPGFLFITVTMSFLFAGLAGIGRMSTDSEIIAPQVVGLNFWRLSRPVMVYGGLLTLFLFLVSNWIGPMLNRAWLEQSKNYREIAMPNIQPGVINPLGKSMLYVDRLEGDRLAELVFVNTNEEQEEILLAEHATIYETRDLDLYQAVRVDLKADQSIEVYETSEMTLGLPIPGDLDALGLKGAPRDLFDTPTLVRWWQSGQAPNTQDLEIEIFQRLINPFVCLIFSLFAVPLAAKHARVRRGSGFGTSLFLIGIFFMASKIARDAASQEKIPILIGMIGPAIMFLAIGIVLQVGKNLWWSQPLRRAQDRVGHWLTFPVQKLFDFLKKRKSDPELREADGSPAQTFIFPSRLDMYITKSFLGIFLLVQSSLLVLALIVEYTQIGKHIQRNDVALEVVLRYMGYKIPEMLDLTFFVCLLISTLILLAVMSKHQEVTAVRAAGGSLQRLCLPLIICGLGASVASFYMGNTFLPFSNRRAATLRNEIRNKTEATFSQDVWLKTAPGELLNFQVYDHRGKRLIGLRRYSLEGPDGTLIQRTDLPRVVFDNGWKAEVPGRSWTFLRDPNHKGEVVPRLTVIEAGESLALGLKHDDLLQKRRKPREFSIKELRGYIGYIRGLGYIEPSYATELYVKYAQPFMPIIMILLALPLGFQFGRRGTFFGVGMGLVAGLLFLGLFEALRQMGASGLIHPIVAGWAIVLLFGFFSLYRFVNLE